MALIAVELHSISKHHPPWTSRTEGYTPPTSSLDTLGTTRYWWISTTSSSDNKTHVTASMCALRRKGQKSISIINNQFKKLLREGNSWGLAFSVGPLLHSMDLCYFGMKRERDSLVQTKQPIWYNFSFVTSEMKRSRNGKKLVGIFPWWLHLTSDEGQALWNSFPCSTLFVVCEALANFMKIHEWHKSR